MSVHANKFIGIVMMLMTCVVTSAAQEIAGSVNTGGTFNTVEIGAGGVGTASYKAAEYNGLQNQGGSLPGAVDFRGGSHDGRNGGVQWRVKGYDLGLETRSVAGEIEVQSKFRVKF